MRYTLNKKKTHIRILTVLFYCCLAAVAPRAENKYTGIMI